MFVILLHYTKPLTEVDAHLEAHRAFLEKEFARGHFLASGPRVPRTGGVVLAKNIARKDLERLLAEDPFHAEQIARYEIIEFSPTKFCTGAAELFFGQC